MASMDYLATEKKLLEILERVERNKSAYAALYIEISKLKPQKRHTAFIKILAKLFYDISGSAEGNLYVLSNNDFVILGKNISQQVIENAIKKLHLGLIDDPILLEHKSEELIKIYEFPDSFEEFRKKIEKLSNSNNNANNKNTTKIIEDIRKNLKNLI